MHGSRDGFRSRLEGALNELQRTDPRKAQILMLRYFAGLSLERIAQVMDMSDVEVENEWRFTRARLHRQLRPHTTRDRQQEVNHG